MEVENPEELIQVLLNNPASRSALSSFIEQTVKKNHVSTLINLHRLKISGLLRRPPCTLSSTTFLIHFFSF